MRGSINGFQFGVDLMFDIGKHGGRNVLDLAVLVRRSSELPSKLANPAFLRPPPGATAGGGGIAGPFTLQFWLPQRELWVDGVRLLTVPDEDNVVLVDERAGGLSAVSTEQVSLDFESGTVPLRSADPLAVWIVLLRAAFARSSRVAAFLASSAHPSFEPLPDRRNIRGRDLAPGIDSWYSIRVVDGRPQLQCAVVVKLSEASRNAPVEPAWRRVPPFGESPATGTSFGPYDVVYDIERSVLWVNGTAQASANGTNVFLFDERNGSLEWVTSLALDPDLRAAPRWREALLNSSAFQQLAALPISKLTRS